MVTSGDDLAAEEVDVHVGRQQRHRVELAEEARRPDQRHLPQRLERHLRAHRMPDQHDPLRPALAEEPEQPLQPVAGEERAVAVVGVEPRVRRRRPGVVDAQRRRAEVVQHLRLPIDPLGEVGVEAVHEDEDPPVAGPVLRQLRVDRGEESVVVGDARCIDGQEVRPRVGRQALGESSASPAPGRAAPRCRSARSRAPSTAPARRRPRLRSPCGRWRRRSARPRRRSPPPDRSLWSRARRSRRGREAPSRGAGRRTARAGMGTLRSDDWPAP